MKKTVYLLAASLLLAVSAHALGTLDGKIFGGQVVEKGQGVDRAQPADFTFADGALKSSFSAAAGYGPAKYTAGTENGFMKFEAPAAKKSGDKIRWSGMVRGQDIEGIFTITEKGKPREYWFKGRLK